MSSDRGFSFESDQILDMRMDQRLGVTANDMLKVLTEKQLTEVFREFGGEREAKSIAREIKKWQAKYGQANGMTGQNLAELILRVKRERTKLHPATKVFQALRIVVNSELDNISSVLDQVNQLAVSGTRLVTIAFHEGEDRIVKHSMLRWEKQGRGHRVNKEVITASAAELTQNKRARSAKLRIFEYEQ
jgi:16S rRNA (cytosine1402-N4)-methyltransferase